MWTSNRRHIYRVCGIRLHPNGFRVFDCVDAKPATLEIEKHLIGQKVIVRYMEGRYRQQYLRVRVFNNFVNNVDIEPWSRILCSRHPITSERRVFGCVDEKEAT